METIKIICARRANFYKPESGGAKFRVLYQDLNHPIEAPVWILKTETYADMRKEGTIFVLDDAQKAPEMASVEPPAVVMNKNASEPANEPEGPVAVAAAVVETEPSAPRKRTRKKKGDAE